MQAYGKYVMIAGVLIVLAGIIMHFFGNRIGWIGKLPGDIRIERENFSFYFPVVTCLLASGLITVILRVVKWLLS